MTATRETCNDDHVSSLAHDVACQLGRNLEPGSLDLSINTLSTTTITIASPFDDCFIALLTHQHLLAQPNLGHTSIRNLRYSQWTSSRKSSSRTSRLTTIPARRRQRPLRKPLTPPRNPRPPRPQPSLRQRPRVREVPRPGRPRQECF